MDGKLLGLEWSNSTKKAMMLLDDAGIPYSLVDLEESSSRKMEAMVALTGKTEIPQLFVGGISYVGLERIRIYIGITIGV